MTPHAAACSERFSDCCSGSHCWRGCCNNFKRGLSGDFMVPLLPHISHPSRTGRVASTFDRTGVIMDVTLLLATYEFPSLILLVVFTVAWLVVDGPATIKQWLEQRRENNT